MKSSGPLFTRQNPFQPASRAGRAHYHPSCNQPLSRQKKKTALSPVRTNQRSSSQIHTPNAASRKSSDKCDQKFVAADEQPVFPESWPSTDCGSPPSSTATTSDMGTRKPSAASSKPAAQQDSVLAKYIERFRHGRPQSREERQQAAAAIGDEQLPCWWTSTSPLPPSSAPTKTTDKDHTSHPLREDHMRTSFSPAGQRYCDRSPSPHRGSLSILSDTSQGELDDTDILQLQEKAGRLLLRGYEDDECSPSDGSVPVSSEGLGCSDFSSPVSVDEPLQRPLASGFTKSLQAVSSQKPVFPSLAPPARPEEDILFQWRLRRKMEQARECPQSLQQYSHHGATFSWQPSSLHHFSAGKQKQTYKQQDTHPTEFSQRDTHAYSTDPHPDAKEALRPFPPAAGPPSSPVFVVSGSPVSQQQTVSHVPAHMHLLCDVLPCPVQLSNASTRPNVSQSIGDVKTKVVSKEIRLPAEPKNIASDEPVHGHKSSTTYASRGAQAEEPLHNKTSESKKKEHTKKRESGQNAKKPAVSVQKQKKPTRYSVDKEHTDGPKSTKRTSSHKKPPKKAMPSAELQQQKHSQGFSSDSQTGDRAQPPSPVHSALVQVVSEVLFPTVDSSPARKTTDSLVSPPGTISTPQQSTAPPRDTDHSVEVISQLLQEAEDSDEKEFEDDTLLQVLRKQRKWVKEQISDVESLLTEFLDDHKVT